MNIENQLKKAKQVNFETESTNEIISEVKLLLDSSETEDLRISNALGSHHSLAMAQKKIGIQLELNRMDNKYAGDVYKIEDIKKLCIKFHLRFLRSQSFAGHLDISAIHKIKAFSKETNTVISDGALNYNFYILAPDESFNLKEERLPRKSDDPAIFYKIDETHFKLIHKWGNDFTVLRLLKGLYWRSFGMQFFLTVFITAAIIAGIVFILPIHPAFYAFCFWGLLAARIKCNNAFEASNSDSLYSPHSWNSEYRYR